MSQSEKSVTVDTITESYLDLADVELAAAENQVLEVTGINRNDAELALEVLTQCFVQLLIRATNTAFSSGYEVGISGASHDQAKEPAG
jgi:hypothetical protein